MKRAFTFTRDYTAGTRDANGQMRTGQELMSIRAYRDELFAATSAFTDPRLYIEGDPDYTGCQVLRKPAPDAEWQVDVSFGKRYLRTDYLDVVRFTKDAGGQTLPQPVEMLVATIWDVGEIVRDSRISGRNRRLTLAVRDDASGRWTLVHGPAIPDQERGFACIRSLAVHTDKVTGREYLFIAAGCGGMYKAVFDPSAPGRIRWLEGDELDRSYGRGQSMCEANGDLYVSYDYGGLLVQGQAGGVFHRIDGATPRWERVYRNHDPTYPTWNQTGRGITAAPAEDGSGKEVILVGIENPPEPIIVRIEPHHGHRAVVELDYNQYFTRVFGRKPQMLGGSAQHPHAGNEIPALNRFDPFIEPESGKLQRFVTLFLFHPDDPAEGCSNAYFLIRRGPGEYDWGEVASDLPAGESLRGVRTIEKSPFPDEPDTYYFGGFFSGPDVQPPRPDLAWIFKGVVGKRERGNVAIAPAAEVVAPARYEDAGHGFSFQYPSDMVRARPGVMTMPDERRAPAVLVDAVAARTVREAAVRAFRDALGAPELLNYTERNLYLGSSTGVAGNLQPGGRVGKRFTYRYLPGADRPPSAAVGMGWTEGDRTMVIAVSHWGEYTEGMANVLLNKIIASLKIERGVVADRRAAAGAMPASRQGAGRLDAMLESLDTNGGADLSAEEAAQAPSLLRLPREPHTDRETRCSREEIRAASSHRPALAHSSGPPPATELRLARLDVETREITSFVFRKDYFPGTRDANGQCLSGSEVMRITSHRGELFAATSMFRDPWMEERYEGYTGAQVLRKTGPSAGWQVDVSFGPRYLRTDALEVIRFTHDADGAALSEPVEMLAAGIWDLGWNASGKDRSITVAIRDDATGQWTLSNVARVPDADRGFASVRAMKVHRDQATGAQYLFVGAANGGIFKGVLDAGAPGRIRWVDGDEVDSSFGRPQSLAVCNGSLYASFDYGGITVQGQQGGIFHRQDGVEPLWQLVYRNYDPRFPRWNQAARGITSVPLDDGSGEEYLLAAIESIPEPIIIRIEPQNGHRPVTEVNYLDLFTEVFGRPPKADESGLAAAALNYFELFRSPSGTREHFVTTTIRHPDDPAQGFNGAYFLIRRSAARYDWCEITPAPDLVSGSNLRGVRTIERSPFPEEPHVYYFGGYSAGIVEPMQANTAWIYRGSLRPLLRRGGERRADARERHDVSGGASPGPQPPRRP